MLRINAPLSFDILHLASLWPKFMLQYPDVHLDVSLIDRVVDIVEEAYDLAIRISRAVPTSNVARKLAVSHNIVCASPAYLRRHGTPQVPDDLLRHRCVGYSYAATADEWKFLHRQGKPRTVKVPCVMHVNNGDTARAAALGGLGIIWQPSFVIGADLRAGRLVALLPDYHLPDIDVHAVYPSRRHLSAKVRVMIDFLVKEFKDVPPWGRER